MVTSLNPLTDVGILGAGQLAQMLTACALKLNLRPFVLAERAGSPAELAGAKVIHGNLDHLESVVRLFEKVSVVIFENEFIDCELLKAAAKKTPHTVIFQPAVGVMESFRDKLRQKNVLTQMNIPTASYEAFDLAKESLLEWLTRMHQRFDGRFVLKWGRFGYDGKGVFVFDPSEIKAAADFCQVALKRKVSLYAESKVNFKRELAMLCIQSIGGEFASYPLVISEQYRGVCRRIYGPATALGVSKNIEAAAERAGRLLAKKTGLVGAFAVEFFELASGELLVNEISPRVHNSGHYTQDGAVTSQFENHWRAVWGMPLGSTKTRPGFAMLNILGPEISVPAQGILLPEVSPPAQLHWYGKDTIAPLRKLGHINVAAEDSTEIPALLTRLEEYRRIWEEAVVGKKI